VSVWFECSRRQPRREGVRRARRDIIGALASAIDRPLNIMAGPGAPSTEELGRLGVARVSGGPGDRPGSARDHVPSRERAARPRHVPRIEGRPSLRRIQRDVRATDLRRARTSVPQGRCRPIQPGAETRIASSNHPSRYGVGAGNHLLAARRTSYRRSFSWRQTSSGVSKPHAVHSAPSVDDAAWAGACSATPHTLL
jgi:hypothetical protein